MSAFVLNKVRQAGRRSKRSAKPQGPDQEHALDVGMCKLHLWDACNKTVLHSNVTGATPPELPTEVQVRQCLTTHLTTQYAGSLQGLSKWQG